MLPSCPISRQSRQSKCGRSRGYQHSVSSVELERKSGLTGLELGRYCSSKEYSGLSSEQKNVLRLYRLQKGSDGNRKGDAEGGKGKRKGAGGDHKNGWNKRQMKAVVASAMKHLQVEKDNRKGEPTANASVVVAMDTKDE